MRILSQLNNSNEGPGYQPLVFPSESPPAAPPRRRRKSVDTSEPIYAVVDFSKKLNRRNLQPQPRSDYETELSIEHSFAAIIESFSHHSIEEDQVQVKTADPSSLPYSSEEEQEEEEEEEPGIITRLVFRGNVIQQTDFVV